jgi:hypothetical protein
MKIKSVVVGRLPFTYYERPEVAPPVRVRVNSKVLSVISSDNIIYVHMLEPELVQFRGELYDPTVLWTWHLKIAGDTVKNDEWYIGTVKAYPNDLHVFATWNDEQ